jgi:hypothetical protein
MAPAWLISHHLAPKGTTPARLFNCESDDQLVQIVIAFAMCGRSCHPRKQNIRSGAPLNLASEGLVKFEIGSLHPGIEHSGPSVAFRPNGLIQKIDLKAVERFDAMTQPIRLVQ